MSLVLDNISISIDSTVIVQAVSVAFNPGSVHVLMGPNGVGKSSLAYALAGHPAYTITHGAITYNGSDITHDTADKRARSGIFLALQNPPAIPGVSLKKLLEESYRAVHNCQEITPLFYEQLQHYCTLLRFPYHLIERSVHDGFSGGEKKKIEILQLLVLAPHIAILDEIDSGVDHDSLSCIVAALHFARQANPSLALCIITHHARITKLIVPDYVHVIYKGTLIQSGTSELSTNIDLHGYDQFKKDYETQVHL